MGPRSVMTTGLLVVLVGLGACGDEDEHVADSSFCHLASSEDRQAFVGLDVEDLVAVRPDLLRLRAVAPATIRHDLARLLAADDVGDAGASDADDLALSASRLDRYLHDTCGIGR